MGMVLRTTEVPPRDREEFIRTTIWDHVLPVEIHWEQSPSDIDLVCRLAIAGPLNFSSARSGTNGLRRTSRLARLDHDPRIFVAIQAEGTTRVEQGANQAELHRGDMVVYDSTRPYSVTNVDQTLLHYFQIPRSALALPQAALDRVLGTRIGLDNNALAPVVAPYLSSLGSSGVLDQPAAAELVAEPSIQLLRALIATHIADPGLAREPLESSLTLRIQEYIRTHLRERDLTATRIAAAHHISVRHLYTTMSRAGISVHASIQRQRLDECRRDLRDPRWAHLAVATIGARWGFVDPSHFGRSFKTAYGMTPNEWRARESGATAPVAN
ncbi:MAG: helix-turn-helix domain-containing protein [Propionibacteriaceae bacterium]